MQPTHHMESSVFDEAHKGNMFKLVRRYNTATQRSGCSLRNTIHCVQIEAMMRQTLGVDANEIADEKEVPDEEPPEEHDDQDRDRLFKDMTEVTAPRQKAIEDNNLVEDHRTREEGEIAPLDALYPTMRVSSDGEKQQTHHRMSAMHESTYQEDVKNETYRENRSCAKNVVMTALHHPRDRQTHTSPALTRMQGASRRQGAGEAQEDQDDPLRHGGGEGHS